LEGKRLNILFVGDIMGKPGRWALSQLLPGLKKKYAVDFTIVNIENSAGGYGCTPQIAQKIKSYGADLQTSGNHIWDRKEILQYMESDPNFLRPANHPPGTPGFGSRVKPLITGQKVAVLNLEGRVYMRDLEDPFRYAEREIEELKKETPIIIVDFHAEATSEKQAMGWYLDGKVSAVIGTHTHVQAADEQILPGGTAFITDVGMTGPHKGVIGINAADALARFLTQLPHRFTVATEDIKLSAVVVSVDEQTGKATKIERLRIDFKPEGQTFEETE